MANTLVETLQIMVEALEVGWSPKYVNGIDAREKGMKAIQAGRALLEELKEQEPVARIEIKHYRGEIESWRIVNKPINAPEGEYDVYTHPQPAQPKAEPDLSGLKPSTQEAIKRWIADGTFIERAIGAMQEQERENMRLEKTVAAQPKEPLTDEQIDELLGGYYISHWGNIRYEYHRSIARAIEAAHGIGKGEA